MPYPRVFLYLCHEDEKQDECGSNKEPGIKHNSIGIIIPHQRVGGDYDHSQDKTSDICGSYDGL